MRKPLAAILAVVSLALVAACSSSSSSSTSGTPSSTSAPQTHTVTDTAGRAVVLPMHVQRIADVGATPVVNSLLFVFQAGNLLVNGLPAALNKPDFALQKVFAPRLATNPSVEGNIGAVNTEALAALHPDVVFTNVPTEVTPLTTAGFKVVVISWSSPAGLAKAVTLMGQILGEQSKAAAYLQYVSAMDSMVKADIAGTPSSSWPRVAYLQYQNLAEAAGSEAHYWLPAAGGTDVEYASDAPGDTSYSAEQLIKWNPQIILTQARSDAYSYEHDPRFANVAAVKDHQVYIVPAGAQHWGNATSETPLVELWTAKLLHPSATANIDIQAQASSFYQRFYGVTLTSAQLSDIINSSLEPNTAGG